MRAFVIFLFSMGVMASLLLLPASGPCLVTAEPYARVPDLYIMREITMMDSLTRERLLNLRDGRTLEKPHSVLKMIQLGQANSNSLLNHTFADRDTQGGSKSEFLSEIQSTRDTYVQKQNMFLEALEKTLSLPEADISESSALELLSLHNQVTSVFIDLYHLLNSAATEVQCTVYLPRRWHRLRQKF